MFAESERRGVSSGVIIDCYRPRSFPGTLSDEWSTHEWGDTRLILNIIVHQGKILNQTQFLEKIRDGIDKGAK